MSSHRAVNTQSAFKVEQQLALEQCRAVEMSPSILCSAEVAAMTWLQLVLAACAFKSRRARFANEELTCKSGCEHNRPNVQSP